MESKLLSSQCQKYAIRLQKGENFFVALTNFFRSHNIQFAQINAIGAVHNVTIGAFEKGEYFKETYSQILELVSCTGNVTLKDNQLYIHAHSTLSYWDESRKKIITVAGHLFEATVGVTVEIFVEAYSGIKVSRKFDKDCHLNIWNLTD